MTPQQALDYLSRTASAAHAAGATTDADVETARIAVRVIRAALEEPRDRNTAAPQPAAGSDATP